MRKLFLCPPVCLTQYRGRDPNSPFRVCDGVVLCFWGPRRDSTFRCADRYRVGPYTHVRRVYTHPQVHTPVHVPGSDTTPTHDVCIYTHKNTHTHMYPDRTLPPRTTCVRIRKYTHTRTCTRTDVHGPGHTYTYMWTTTTRTGDCGPRSRRPAKAVEPRTHRLVPRRVSVDLSVLVRSEEGCRGGSGGPLTYTSGPSGPVPQDPPRKVLVSCLVPLSWCRDSSRPGP